MTCGECLKAWANHVEWSAQAKRDPDEKRGPNCWSTSCYNADAHIDGIDEWITMAFWLHGNQLVANSGIGRDLLEQADCMDAETLETLIRISALIEKFRAEKRKREAEAAQNS